MSREQWQPKIGGEPGEIVTRLGELAQSLSMVLTTVLGSVPGRPLYGSRLHELVDAPFDEVRLLAPRYVREAMVANLPRHKFRGVEVVMNDQASVTVRVTWAPRDGGAAQTTGVTL